jgi:hypothetical protein
MWPFTRSTPVAPTPDIAPQIDNLTELLIEMQAALVSWKATMSAVDDLVTELEDAITKLTAEHQADLTAKADTENSVVARLKPLADQLQTLANPTPDTGAVAPPPAAGTEAAGTTPDAGSTTPEADVTGTQAPGAPATS